MAFKLKVFISSTQEDLGNERRAVAEVIERCGYCIWNGRIARLPLECWVGCAVGGSAAIPANGEITFDALSAFRAMPYEAIPSV